MSVTQPSAPSIDPQEVAYFARLAERWWDPQGPFWPLHRLNAFRIGYIRQQLCTLFGRAPEAERPLEGLEILDIGCGGGILSESLARLGARVSGIDVVEKNIQVARLHAQQMGLSIDYRLVSVERLAEEGADFDAVMNLEVVEHVEDLPGFLAACGRLVRPGGAMVVATINRTWAAWLMAILGAEYILRWLPRGTHRYCKLVRPEEVIRGLGEGYRLVHRTGVRIDPFTRRFSHTTWLGVNYMLVLQRVGG